MRSGTDLAPTCFSSGCESVRRVDAAFLNHVASSAFQGLQLLQDTGIPTRVPLALQMSCEQYSHTFFRAQLPKCCPLKAWTKWKPSDEQELCEQVIAKHKSFWESAIASSDVNLLWDVWNQIAEEYLFERSFLDHSEFDQFWSRSG